MKNYNKKAFTLIEMAIVLTILAMVMGTVISMTKISYQKNKLYETKQDISKIKQSMIGYMGINHKLPSSDTTADGKGDGVKGEGNTGIGNIPYIDLQVSGKDEFGMVYQYDVNDDLLETNSTNLCLELSSISKLSIESPHVENHNTPTADKYALAAVVISKGQNKILTGKNDDADRKSVV